MKKNKRRKKNNSCKYPNLQKERLNKDMTQKDVAKVLHVSARCYCYYEHGEREIPIETWKKLSQLHEKSIEYLSSNTLTKK